MSIQFLTTYFNFTDSKKLKKNYIKFRKNFPYKIHTAEICLPHQQFFIDDSIKFTIDYTQIAWQKERLLNILLTYLPASTEAIVWVDADIIFKNKYLLHDIEQTLFNYPVAQVFENVYENSDNSSHNTVSFAKDRRDNLGTEWPAIGFGWAMRKEVLNNGFFDLDIVGNGDALQLISWLGLWDHQLISILPPNMKKEYLLWAIHSFNSVEGKIGCIKGDIEHLYHGTRENRQYWHRNKILTDNNYNPNTHITFDNNGLLIITDYNIQKQLHQYFINRKDDK